MNEGVTYKEVLKVTATDMICSWKYLPRVFLDLCAAVESLVVAAFMALMLVLIAIPLTTLGPILVPLAPVIAMFTYRNVKEEQKRQKEVLESYFSQTQRTESSQTGEH